MTIKFYGFWRSLAAYRVRVALKFKGLAYEEIPVNLLTGQQHDPAYLQINPQGAVPAVVFPGASQPLFQSMAILDYLELTFPNPSLMPVAPERRARILALCHICTSDAHPLVVPRVRNYLQNTLGLDESARNAWLQHWMLQALTTCEQILQQEPAGRFSQGNEVTWADICLASQVVGAGFFGCQLNRIPRVLAVYEELLKLEPFAQSMPMLQAGAPTSGQH